MGRARHLDNCADKNRKRVSQLQKNEIFKEMNISRNIDLRPIGAAEYIVKFVEPGNYTYHQQNERLWNLRRNIEVCRSIDEHICLGLFTIEITDDGKLVNIIDGQERTAILYEILHPEVRKDKKRLMIHVGQDEYTENDFLYVDSDYEPKRPYEYWLTTAADTLSLACLLNEKPFRENEKDYRDVAERLKKFNKYFNNHTLGLQLLSFYKETCGDSVDIQRIRLRGRLNRT